MTTSHQQSRQDGHDMTLGALFLVDNAPKGPRGMSWRKFSDWVIADHLKRHSYYYHEKKERKHATVVRLRARLLQICHWNSKEMLNPYGEYKDRVDVLFETGGSDFLREQFLKGQGYDKHKFSECQLNKHVSEEDRPADAKVDGRPEDNMAEGGKGSNTDQASNDVTATSWKPQTTFSPALDKFATHSGPFRTGL